MSKLASAQALRRAIVLSASIGFSGQAFAQPSPPGPAPTQVADEAPAEVETDETEIVVTAQKREESVQDVPLSVLAFSANKLRQSNVTDILSLPRVSPGLSVAKPGYTAAIRVAIRGVGAAGNVAAEPSVATFLDGIYLARPGSTFASFLDIGGIEVLRGPQGTLFGRNASAGAISLKSAMPENELFGTLRAEAAYGDRYRLEGVANIPLSDNAAIRFAGLGELFQGYYKNKLDGNTYGGVDTYATRLSGKFTPAPNLTAILRVDYSQFKGDGFFNYEFPRSVADLPGFPNYVLRTGGFIPELDPFDQTINQFIDDRVKDRQWGASGDISYDTGGGFTFRLLSGYRDWVNRQYFADILWSDREALGLFNSNDSKSHSQELQIISPEDKLLGGRLSFVGGVYYFKETFKIGEKFSIFPDFCDIIIRFVAPGLLNSCLAAPSTDGTTALFTQKVRSIAGYGEAKFAVASTLDLILGARWSKDKKHGRVLQQRIHPVSALLRANEDTSLRLTETQPTWRAVLNWQPTDRHMAYLSYSTGYKSGGFNSGGSNISLGQRRIFNAEKTKNYEAGVKTQWLNRKLTANLTAFRMDIDGFQDRAFDGLTFLTRNAGALRQQGVEVELRAAPSRNLSFDFSMMYLDSEFTDYRGAAGLPGKGGTRDLTGFPNSFSPKYSGSVGAQYQNRIGNGGMTWMVNGVLAFNSKQYVAQTLDGNPQAIQDAYQVLSGRATLYGPQKLWSLYAFGDNLLDKGSCAQLSYQVLDGPLGLRDPVTGFTGIRCVTNPPRTYGVGASMRF